MFMIIQLIIVEFIIVKPIIDSQAMEGTSDADPASLNNFCSQNRRTVMCGTCRKPLQKVTLLE